MEQLILGEGLVVLAQDDIRQTFDNVPINLAIECFARYVNDADLLNLIGVILRGHAGYEKTVGIDQGNPRSPLALNLVLDQVLDRPSVADPVPTTVLRYADNIIGIARTTAEARHTLLRATELLTPHGFTLKGEANQPVILTRQGARAETLGFQIRLEPGRLAIALGRGAHRNLDQALNRAQVSQNPPLIAKEVVRAWISSYAPGLESADVRQIVAGVRQLAAQQGFRECHDETSLGDMIAKASQRWVAFRERYPQGESPLGTPPGHHDRSEEILALCAEASEVPF